MTPLFDIELKRTWMYDGYFEAIEDAGGIPVMFSIKNGQEEIVRLLEIVDGIMLPGGRDIHPLNYGDDVTEHCRQTVPDLDKTEMLLVRAAFERGIPVLGICRGSQLINVAMGGKLCQDIPALANRSIKIIHAQNDIIPNEYPVHKINITVNSRLYECFGCDSIMVNSLHHQASTIIAGELFASACSDDGITEAVECNDKSKFLLGVQWHPELMYKKDENAKKLFNYFINHIKSN